MMSTKTHLVLLIRHMARNPSHIICHLARNPGHFTKGLNSYGKAHESLLCMQQALNSHACVQCFLISLAHGRIMALMFGRRRGHDRPSHQVKNFTDFQLVFGLLLVNWKFAGEPPPWSSISTQGTWWLQDGVGFSFSSKEFSQSVTLGNLQSFNQNTGKRSQFSKPGHKNTLGTQETWQGREIAGSMEHFLLAEVMSQSGCLMDSREFQEICKVLGSHEEHICCNRSSLFNVSS